jgi:hypothetical protein
MAPEGISSSGDWNWCKRLQSASLLIHCLLTRASKSRLLKRNGEIHIMSDRNKRVKNLALVTHAAVIDRHILIIYCVLSLQRRNVESCNMKRYLACNCLLCFKILY